METATLFQLVIGFVLDRGARAEAGMPERNDRNTHPCRHSRRRCAVVGQAETTNKSLNRKKKRPAKTSGPGRKALLSLTQRESPNTRKPGSRIATIRPPRNSAPAEPTSSAHHMTRCAIATTVAVAVPSCAEIAAFRRPPAAPGRADARHVCHC